METRCIDLGRKGPSSRRLFAPAAAPRSPSAEVRAAQELLPHPGTPRPLPQRGRSRVGGGAAARPAPALADGHPCSPITLRARSRTALIPAHTRADTRPLARSLITHGRAQHPRERTRPALTRTETRARPRTAHTRACPRTCRPQRGQRSVPAWLCGTASSARPPTWRGQRAAAVQSRAEPSRAEANRARTLCLPARTVPRPAEAVRRRRRCGSAVTSGRDAPPPAAPAPQVPRQGPPGAPGAAAAPPPPRAPAPRTRACGGRRSHTRVRTAEPALVPADTPGMGTRAPARRSGSREGGLLRAPRPARTSPQQPPRQGLGYSSPRDIIRGNDPEKKLAEQ